MKNIYKLKSALSINGLKGILALAILYFSYDVKAQTPSYVFFNPFNASYPGWVISNGSAAFPAFKGLFFAEEDKEALRMTSSSVISFHPFTANKTLNLGQNLNFSYLGGVGQGDINNVNIIQGKDDLLLVGSKALTDNQVFANIYISEAGLVGVGRNVIRPNGALHVIGLDNDGTSAALTVDDNRGQRMLLDGNEIDAINNSLNLQINSAFDLNLVAGGGNVGVGGVVPAAKVHVSGGDLRLDDGLFLTGKEMIFRPGASSDSASNNIIFRNNGDVEIMRINKDGNVGIGTPAPSEKLEIEGTVKATSFVSSASSFPDYVFDPEYSYLSLAQIDSFVKSNRHLPNMPKESEVLENGLDVTNVMVKSVENIETIFLHLIDLNERLEALEKENANLKAQLKK